ncbi:outer membrane receptor protein involved in Fe transport [Flavobacteriaceae bacterium MAR_2010_105]|nr:outer membrane receptor protein involved in Fe transport [Flavobacteriaceae bacterium MAR_2010_105]
MTKKDVLYLFISLFFLNCYISLSAQNVQEEAQPLVIILRDIESRFDITFSYADETIKDKTLLPPNPEWSLLETIDYLKVNSQLDFEVLDNRFVIIKTPNVSQRKNKVEQLPEIVINNYLTSGIIKTNNGTVVIKPKSFGILPGLIEPDILQAVQALPGVLSTDETVSNINVRGGTHDQNLLLWDGIKMFQSGHFFGLISAYNPYLTEKVNVYKNGTSAQFGDGVSSILDMQLSNDIESKFEAGAGFNLINIDGFAKIPLSKKMELQVSSRRSVTDLIITPTYDQYFKRVFQDSDLTNNQGQNSGSISKNETFYFYDITSKLLYDLSERDKLRFNFLTIYNNLNYEEQSRVNNIDEVLNSSLLQRNLATGISYTRDWSDKFLSSAQVYLSNYNLDATNFDLTNNQRLIQENEVYDSAFKLDLDYTIDSNLKLSGGYHFFETGISNLEDVNNPEFRSYIKEVIRSNSLYIEGKYSSNNNNTSLRFGTRFNYIKKFDKVLVEPRLSFNQRFLNYFRFEILGEFKSQTTSQIIDLQNDFLGVENRRWVLSNNKSEPTDSSDASRIPSIVPIPIIKSKQLSAGIHYSKNKLLISAEAFIKDVKGITTRSQGFQNQYQFVNAIGNYRAKGIDFLINKQFSAFSTWLSYSYSKNDYTFNTLNNGDPFPNNLDIRHVATFAGTYAFNNFKLALGANWHSGKPSTLPSTVQDNTNDRIEYASPNSTRLDDYIRADFSTTYTFDLSPKTNAVIGASIWNLLNQKNIINTYHTLDADSNITTIENQSLGITPNVSLRIHF